MPPYHFIGDVTGLTSLPGGIELHADGPRVRVRFVSDGIVQVRGATGGDSFDEPPFSYAVSPETWQTAPPDVQVEETEEAVAVRCGAWRVVVERTPLRLRLEDQSGRRFAADSWGMTWQRARVGVWKRHAEGERFYGLGEKAWRLDRTHHTFVNWNTDAPKYREGDDPLYKTLPFYLALTPDDKGRHHAYGVFFDNTHRSTFDFGGGARGHVGFEAEGGELVYYLFAGPTPADVLRRYTALTGRMPLPPRWALGYQQSRWSYYPDDEVETLVRQFRTRRIPLDVVYLDIHYMDGYRVFTWHPERFPDPQGLLARLRERGVRTVALVDPGVKKDPGYHVHDDGLEQGAFVTYPDGTVYTGEVWPGECHFPDFTSPGVRDWFGGYFKGLLDDGVAALWVDMNEPSNFQHRTLPGFVQHDMEGRGGTHDEAHNVYGLLMARTAFEAQKRRTPGERPFVLTRAAYAGVQRYSAVWTGDNASTWDDLRLSVPMLLGLGLSGVPFAGADVGGFLGGAPTPELYARWIQLGAFTPFFRTHSAEGTPRQEPWSYGETVEAIAQRAIELRYRLLPLWETLFDEHRRTGLPPMRPLLLHYPDDPNVHGLGNTFLVGEHLLVAPVLREGARARDVYLPAGAWYDVWTGERLQGGKVHLVHAPLARLPLFAKAGAVLPFGPVRQHTDEAAPSELELRLFPGSGTSPLYEDDGATLDYQRGQFRRTTFRLAHEEEGLTLHRTAEGAFASPLQTFTLKLGAAEAPASATVDGAPLDDEILRYDAAARTLRLTVPASFETVQIRPAGSRFS